MAHFYEALIFFGPRSRITFVSHYAGTPGAELDKDLPFLYIHGGNDSGKGMFIRFAIRLISNGYVAEPVEGTQFTKDAINRCRGSNTVFLFVVDDVDKGNVERDIVKTYWEGAGMAVSFPTFIFTSNHTKPQVGVPHPNEGPSTSTSCSMLLVTSARKPPGLQTNRTDSSPGSRTLCSNKTFRFRTGRTS